MNVFRTRPGYGEDYWADLRVERRREEVAELAALYGEDAEVAQDDVEQLALEV